MLKKFTNTIISLFRQETLSERSERMIPGALYGVFFSTVYVLVSSVINVIFLPSLHLGVDWNNLFIQWIEYSIALALAGGLVGWFTEDYMGIVWGGIVLTILILVGNMVASILGSGNSLLSVQTLFTALPVVGTCVLLAGALRVAINRHFYASKQETPEVRRKLFSQLVLVVFLVGLIPGIFSSYGTASQNVIKALNKSLQSDTTYPPFETRFPITKVPSLKDHLGMAYTLYARTSSRTTGALDVTIRFVDGYTITCIVPLDTGETMFLQVCNEGTSITNP